MVKDPSQLRSAVVASRLPVEMWHDALVDPTLADAILDRLVHNAHRIALKGPCAGSRRQAPARTLPTRPSRHPT